MNTITLNRDVRIDNDQVIITENVETTLDKRQLEALLQNIKFEKEGIIGQNNNLIKRYNDLELKEAEYKDCLADLNTKVESTITVI